MLGLRRCVGTRLGNFEATSEEPSGALILREEVATIIFGLKRLSTKKRPAGYFVQMAIISSLPRPSTPSRCTSPITGRGPCASTCRCRKLVFTRREKTENYFG